MEARSNVSFRPEVLAKFEHAPSGVAPARDGRIFLSFPRTDANPAPATLAELIDGRVVPFPDELVNAIDPTDTRHRFVSVHGIALAPRNRLLALDTGARSLVSTDPKSAKLFVIDLDRNVITHAIGFPADVCLPTSYLSDLVIDYARGKAGYAYITDSGPNGPNGIVVVDLDSGDSWRVLSEHPSVRAIAPAGFGIGTELGPKRVSAGIDGIALTPDGRTLWWTPLGSYGLFSIDTDVLVKTPVDPVVVARHVVEHPQRDFACDGLDSDRAGRIYFTDCTHGGLQRLIPSQSRYEQLLHADTRMVWPDSVKLGPERIVYITDSQLDRSPDWNDGQDLREPPYVLYRAAIDADPAQF